MPFMLSIFSTILCNCTKVESGTYNDLLSVFNTVATLFVLNSYLNNFAAVYMDQLLIPLLNRSGNMADDLCATYFPSNECVSYTRLYPMCDECLFINEM